MENIPGEAPAGANLWAGHTQQLSERMKGEHSEF